MIITETIREERLHYCIDIENAKSHSEILLLSKFHLMVIEQAKSLEGDALHNEIVLIHQARDQELFSLRKVDWRTGSRVDTEWFVYDK